MLTSLCLSFSVTFLLLIVLLKTRLADFALDQPNERSLHMHLTPRTGGLAIVCGMLVAWMVADVSLPWLFLILALVGVSLIDDIRGLSVRWRLLVQLLICGFFVYLYSKQLHYLLWLPVLFVMVWMTNLYNFMDGSDGLAGGMGLFGFSSYAIAFYLSGDALFANMSISIAAACFAFLLFNFYPAKIFMGDSGSIPLGFLAGAMALLGCVQAYWPVWFPVLIFSPFIVDATITLIKRLRNGERLSQAHKSHYYQRLVQISWGHKKTAVAEYLLMLLCSLTALLFLQASTLLVIILLVGWILIYMVLAVLIDKHWKQKISL